MLLAVGFSRPGRSLGILVDPERFSVVAVETVDLDNVGAGDAAAAIFADHAHKIVHTGEGIDSLGVAVELAEAYGREWVAGAPLNVEPCACPEIGS